MDFLDVQVLNKFKDFLLRELNANDFSYWPRFHKLKRLHHRSRAAPIYVAFKFFRARLCLDALGTIN